MVGFCFVVQLMVGLHEATSKQASSTAAALASSTRLSTVVSWLTSPFILIIKNVSWTGPVATMYEQIGYNVVDTVAKAIWAIAAGKSRIEEEGARSVVLGLSCPSRGTSTERRLQCAVVRDHSYGFATIFFWLPVPNMTKSNRTVSGAPHLMMRTAKPIGS